MKDPISSFQFNDKVDNHLSAALPVIKTRNKVSNEIDKVDKAIVRSFPGSIDRPPPNEAISSQDLDVKAKFFKPYRSLDDNSIVRHHYHHHNGNSPELFHQNGDVLADPEDIVNKNHALELKDESKVAGIYNGHSLDYTKSLSTKASIENLSGNGRNGLEPDSHNSHLDLHVYESPMESISNATDKLPPPDELESSSKLEWNPKFCSELTEVPPVYIPENTVVNQCATTSNRSPFFYILNECQPPPPSCIYPTNSVGDGTAPLSIASNPPVLTVLKTTTSASIDTNGLVGSQPFYLYHHQPTSEISHPDCPACLIESASAFSAQDTSAAALSHVTPINEKIIFGGGTPPHYLMPPPNSSQLQQQQIFIPVIFPSTTPTHILQPPPNFIHQTEQRHARDSEMVTSELLTSESDRFNKSPTNTPLIFSNGPQDFLSSESAHLSSSPAPPPTYMTEQQPFNNNVVPSSTTIYYLVNFNETPMFAMNNDTDTQLLPNFYDSPETGCVPVNNKLNEFLSGHIPLNLTHSPLSNKSLTNNTFASRTETLVVPSGRMERLGDSNKKAPPLFSSPIIGLSPYEGNTKCEYNDVAFKSRFDQQITGPASYHQTLHQPTFLYYYPAVHHLNSNVPAQFLTSPPPPPNIIPLQYFGIPPPTSPNAISTILTTPPPSSLNPVLNSDPNDGSVPRPQYLNVFGNMPPSGQHIPTKLSANDDEADEDNNSNNPNSDLVVVCYDNDDCSHLRNRNTMNYTPGRGDLPCNNRFIYSPSSLLLQPPPPPPFYPFSMNCSNNPPAAALGDLYLNNNNPFSRNRNYPPPYTNYYYEQQQQQRYPQQQQHPYPYSMRSYYHYYHHHDRRNKSSCTSPSSNNSISTKSTCSSLNATRLSAKGKEGGQDTPMIADERRRNADDEEIPVDGNTAASHHHQQQQQQRMYLYDKMSSTNILKKGLNEAASLSVNDEDGDSPRKSTRRCYTSLAAKKYSHRSQQSSIAPSNSSRASINSSNNQQTFKSKSFHSKYGGQSGKLLITSNSNTKFTPKNKYGIGNDKKFLSNSNVRGINKSHHHNQPCDNTLIKGGIEEIYKGINNNQLLQIPIPLFIASPQSNCRGTIFEKCSGNKFSSFADYLEGSDLSNMRPSSRGTPSCDFHHASSDLMSTTQKMSTPITQVFSSTPTPIFVVGGIQQHLGNQKLPAIPINANKKHPSNYYHGLTVNSTSSTTTTDSDSTHRSRIPESPDYGLGSDVESAINATESEDVLLIDILSNISNINVFDVTPFSSMVEWKFILPDNNPDTLEDHNIESNHLVNSENNCLHKTVLPHFILPDPFEPSYKLFLLSKKTSSKFTKQPTSSDLNTFQSSTLGGYYGECVYSGFAPKCFLDHLNPFTEYEIRICAYFDSTCGKISSALSFKTLSTIPDTPEPPILIHKNKSSITLKWTNPCDNGAKITNYALQMAYIPSDIVFTSDLKSKYLEEKSFSTIYAGDAKQYKITKLNKMAPNQQQDHKELYPPFPTTTTTPPNVVSVLYAFRLGAANQHGSSGFSDPYLAIYGTSIGAPGKPKSPVLMKAVAQSLTLAWESSVPLETTPSPQPTFSPVFYCLQMEDPRSGHGFITVFNGPASPEQTHQAREMNDKDDDLSFPCDGLKNDLICVTVPPSKFDKTSYHHNGPGNNTVSPEFNEIGSLHRNSSYNFRLRVSNEDGSSPWSDVVTFTTTPGLPSCPRKVSVRGKPSETSLKIAWAAPQDDGGSPISRYLVIVSQNETGDMIREIDAGTDRDLTICNLEPGQTYVFHVYAENMVGLRSLINQQATATVLATTAPSIPSKCPPPSITIFTMDNQTTNHESSLKSGIALNRKLERERKAKETPDCSKNAEITTPTPNPYQMECVKLAWEHPPSDGGTAILQYELEFAVLDSSPELLVDLEPKEIIANRLNWMPAYKGATGLSHIFAPNKADGGVIFHPATQYAFRLRPVNAQGPGPWSDFSTFNTSVSVPEAPSTLCIAVKSAHVALVHYEPPYRDNGSPISAYLLEMTKNNNPQTAANFIKIYTGPSLTHEIKSLAPCTTYWFRVAAINGAGQGPYSILSQITTPSSSPGHVSGSTLKCVRKGPCWITLSWEPPSEDRGSPVLKYALEVISPNTAAATQPPTIEISQRPSYYPLSKAAQANNFNLDTQQPSFANHELNGMVDSNEYSSPLPEISSNIISSSSTTSSSIYSRICLTPDATCEYTVQELLPLTSYKFRVQAINAIGTGPFNTGSALIVTTPPSPPARAPTIKKALPSHKSIPATTLDDQVPPPLHYHSILLAENSNPTSPNVLDTVYSLIGCSYVKIRWEYPTTLIPSSESKKDDDDEVQDTCRPEALTYELEMTEDYRKLGFNKVYIGDALSYKVAKLRENTPYHFRVRACNETGYGPFSAIHSFQTSWASPCTIKSFKISRLKSESAFIAWTYPFPISSSTSSSKMSSVVTAGTCSTERQSHVDTSWEVHFEIYISGHPDELIPPLNCPEKCSLQNTLDESTFKLVYHGKVPEFHLKGLSLASEYQCKIRAVRHFITRLKTTSKSSPSVEERSFISTPPQPNRCSDDDEEEEDIVVETFDLVGPFSQIFTFKTHNLTNSNHRNSTKNGLLLTVNGTENVLNSNDNWILLKLFGQFLSPLLTAHEAVKKVLFTRYTRLRWWNKPIKDDKSQPSSCPLSSNALTFTHSSGKRATHRDQKSISFTDQQWAIIILCIFTALACLTTFLIANYVNF